MSRLRFMNIEVDNITMDEALQSIEELIVEKKFSYVVTPNVDHIIQIENDSEFKIIYQNADLILTDGKPLIWISKFYKSPIIEKISGSDLFPLLCECAAKKGYKMFFLGAAEGVAEMAARNLTREHPGLDVVGTYSPPYGFENNDDEIKNIISLVTSAKPDILIVCLGAPKQEKFIYKYRNELSVPVSLGLGASLDFAAGNIKRAPRWMSEHGLEWLFRIMQDPKRLAKRYLYDFVKIIPLVKRYR